MPGPGAFRWILAELRSDIAAIKTRDPAARDVGTLEILAAWPGLHALLGHRLAHALYEARVPLLPRLLALLSRSLTGIEIHPAAQIGERFVIDHGMGVVIGETAEIGDDVTLYQGVTLGGTGFATGKRHPTVQDNVTVGSGAKMLGPITIGHGAKIGANTVVIHDVPPNSTVVGNPGHPVRVEGRRPEGPDADWIHLPDPVAEAIRGLSSRIAAIEAGAEEHASDPDERASDPEERASDPDGRPNATTGNPGRPGGRGGSDGNGQPDGRTNPAVGPNPAGG